MRRVRFELYKRQGIGDGFREFLTVHLSAGSPRVHLLPMEALYGDFAQMLLHAEIDQFVILDHSIVIVVIPEDVLDEVVDLCLDLVQDMD